jgi:hypothetical protein
VRPSPAGAKTMSDAIRSDRVAEQAAAIYDPGDPPAVAPEVDLSLVRWSLSLTPAERLEALTSSANGLIRMANAASHRLHRDS